MNRFKSLAIAIIGSSGMVGSDLAFYLRSDFFKVTGIDRKNYEEYRGRHFDVVINANGNSNKIWAKANVLSDFALSTTSVYQSLFDFPCKTYIYISSADVYPDHSSKKSTSEENKIGPEKLSSYGLHKYLSECIVRNFTKNYIILRCPIILGNKLRKGPIYDILHNARIFVTKDSAFQMITAKELAKTIHFLIQTNITKEIFNIGGQGKVLLNKITKYIQKPVIFPNDGETHIYETDVSKLHKIFPLKTSSEYLKDFLKNYIMR